MVRVRMGLLGRVLVGAGVPTLVAAAAFVTMLGSISDVRDAQGRVATSQEAVIAAEGLSRAVGDVALAQRGRLLGVADSASAESAAADRVRTQASALAELDLAGAGEQGRVADLTAAADAYLRRSQRGADPAAVLLAAVDHRLDAFLAQERVVAAEQERAASAATTRAVTAAGIGLAASLVAVVLVGIYLTRTVSLPIRRAGAVAGRFAGGDLDARLRVTGVGEVGDLQRALNAMAAGLASARAELTASRARIVAADFRVRRSIERDLHDGLQQRLVALALDLRALSADAPWSLRPQVDEVTAGLVEATEELRDFVHGIQPAALTDSGLGAALRTLARRAALPVEVRADLSERLPADVESAAYYFVSEALTNATKHAAASYVEILVSVSGGTLEVVVRDDGVGGADRSAGTGLVGLADRLEALGGRFTLVSPPGDGTTLTATIPTAGQQGAAVTG
ncbi:Signal transduction histidine kinase [Asanoa hainanensis]|uniref:histidine kinase n=1 Tax=Asanoa hainanensis TaxID=560556 RepID=A0A239MDA6_9ACTN|nr:HAMP domain-containing protein [Asanoa hainanensis]SNT40113.1 Signal transduction histidine kinase [Asanoa hainanensis]